MVQQQEEEYPTMTELATATHEADVLKRIHCSTSNIGICCLSVKGLQGSHLKAVRWFVGHLLGRTVYVTVGIIMGVSAEVQKIDTRTDFLKRAL